MSTTDFGEYRCITRLGVGAQSEVVFAEHRRFGAVALKRLVPSAARDPDIVHALQEEASLVMRLAHPNVVRAFEHGVVREIPFVAFELIDGSDLAGVLGRLTERGHVLGLEDVDAIIQPIAAALAHLHAAEGAPIHRDVSPSNVLVGLDGTVKLADFGIARVEGRALRRTEDGVVRGTARYMAPEQVLGREIDARTDQYALASILYELVTGRPLVGKRRPLEVVVDVAQGPSSSATFDAMPQTLAEILQRALARNPEERYASAGDFSHALCSVFPPSAAEERSIRVRELMRSLAYASVRKVGESENTREKFHESAVKSAAMVAAWQTPGSATTTLGRATNALLKERPVMAEEKGGSDLDVFEGLAKKSSRSQGSALPPPPASGPVSAAVPPSLASQSRTPARANTLAGMQAPESVPGRPSSATPPPPSSAAAAAGLTGTATLGTPLPSISSAGAPPPSIRESAPLPPPSSMAKNPPPPPPGASSRASGPPPLPSGSGSRPPSTPPPASSAAPNTAIPSNGVPPPPPPPSTLVAAVPPPPVSVGTALGMPSSQSPEVEAKADAPAEAKPKVRGSQVDMDWEEDEESTHVFEKQKHGLTPGPRATKPPPSVPPPPSKVSAAAALLASSGSAAAPRSLAGVVPAPPAVPAPLPVPPTPRAAPETLISSTSMRSRAAATAVDDAVAAAPPPVIVQSGGSSKLGVILGGLALLAVVALGVYLFMPRTGQLKIDLKAKSGQGIARAEIFVDGQKKCDTSPCVVADLAPGPKGIKVITPNGVVADATESVEAGKEKPVFITIDDSGAPPAPKPSDTATPQPVAATGTGFKMGGQSGAKVLVDGKERGVLPVTLTDLTPGEHKIKIDGGERYEALEKTITVKADQVQDLGETKLKVLKGRLTLELATPGAAVVLTMTKAGRKVEKRITDAMWATPPVRLDIETKDQWKLVATKKGLTDFSADVTFADGEAEKTMSINLEGGTQVAEVTPPTPNTGAPPTPNTGAPPTPNTGKVPTPPTPNTATPAETAAPVAAGMGTLNINSIPPSKVILDGRPLGTTPIIGQQVSAGTHSVTFIHPEKGKKSTSVTVKAGGKAVAAVKFE